MINLFLIILVILSFYSRDFVKLFYLAFGLGVVSDLVLGNLTAVSSLIFLGACLLIYLYQQKFSSTHLLFQLIFISLVSLGFSLFAHEPFFSLSTGLAVFLTLTCWGFKQKFKTPDSLAL